MVVRSFYIFMRCTTSVTPLEPTEPAEPLSFAIKGRYAQGLTLNPWTHMLFKEIMCFGKYARHPFAFP